MKSMNIRKVFVGCLCGLLLPLHSCNDIDPLQSEADLLKERVAALETAVKQMNESVGSLQHLLSGKQIVGITAIDKGYKVEFSDGQSFEVLNGENVDSLLPLLSISSDGYWQYKLNPSDAYTLMLDPDGNPVKAYPTNPEGTPITSPQMRVSTDGYWQVTYNGGATYEFLMLNGDKVPSFPGVGSNSVFSHVVYDPSKQELTVTLSADGKQYGFPVINTFFLTVKGAEGEQVFPLAETRIYEVEQSEVAEATIQAPQGWKVTLEEKVLTITSPEQTDAEKQEKIHLIITSPKHYIRVVTLQAKLLTTKFDANFCTAWNEFANQAAQNVLLDFSYAGYKHGEVAPPEASALVGYKIYNVKEYGAIPGDDLSDREAFFKTLIAAGATKSELSDGTTRFQANNLNAIIYFPEGEYVLQGEGENNRPIHLTLGNAVIRGAGRTKTTLRMDSENQAAVPTDMWSAPSMLMIKHYSGLTDLADVTADAPKGSFSVEVSSATAIKAGEWVCLALKNNDPDLVAQEVTPLPIDDLPPNGDLRGDGVTVLDYHQVKSVNGNRVTFVEPLMHAVEQRWEWKVQKFPHYENIGVEDLAFQGRAKDDFLHHGSVADDGGYKPIEFGRLTNSWMRRVNFVSVSEALTINGCANTSAYDIRIGGNRGHSAIRSAGSSRVFIGKVTDESDGYAHVTSTSIDKGNYIVGAGQYHACGVSKQSMGAVIWNVKWGSDGCFESHATQPRATLIDRCEGAFIPWRQGGDDLQMPNHLDDLVIWNMNATNTASSSGWNGGFVWWDSNSKWWKCMPPVVVGFHGAAITFPETFNGRLQYKRLEQQGTQVAPYSLYEAQLRARLGVVPAWLNSLN